MKLTDVVEEVQRKLRDEISSNSPIALALTGSRAGRYHHDGSDFDFFAIYETDIPFCYFDFDLDGNEISVKIEGKSRLEDKMKSPLHTFAEQGSFVWLPYTPFKGEEYLRGIEREARFLFLDDFIGVLPKSVLVQVLPERIAEYPLIQEALVWPSAINRLRAISGSKINPLEQVIPKYMELLDEKGYGLSGNGTYQLVNNGDGRKNSNTFRNKLRLDVRRYLRKRRISSFKQILLGGLFILFQMPEKVSNDFYSFPKFEESGEQLIYTGPPLDEYVNSRKYLNPLRDQTRRLKQLLISS